MPLVRRLRRLLRSRSQSGTLHTLPDFQSPELGNARDVYVYLPPDYDDEVRRYPVIYMHDGQNLFDTGTAFGRPWHAEEAVIAAARLGRPAIVVGVANAGADRIAEYSPFPDERHGGGRADAYLDFLVDTLKPVIDQTYRTLREPANTGIAGSSMGGLVSLYAAFTRAHTFGFAAVLSPSLWFAHLAIFDVVRRALATMGESRPRIYLDSGAREGERTLDHARALRNLLIEGGYREGVDLRWAEDVKGAHEEGAWGRRFRKALPALLAA
jgi:isoamylase